MGPISHPCPAPAGVPADHAGRPVPARRTALAGPRRRPLASAHGQRLGVPVIPWTVLVFGDRSSGDDGAAMVAVERLPRRLRAGIRILTCADLGPDELVSALLSGPCLILDTVHGAIPGTVIEVPLTKLLAGEGIARSTTHTSPMPIVVGLAASLGAPLDAGAFLGIGGAAYQTGELLSPDVEAGLERYVATIVGHLRARGSAHCA